MAKKPAKKKLCDCGVEIGTDEQECLDCFEKKEKKPKRHPISWELDGTLKLAGLLL